MPFIMTGSSARKLKYGYSNLLAGRAFVYNLYPFSFLEKEDTLENFLHFGTLPKIFTYNEVLEKKQFLKSYALTYLKEEIWNEHLIRKLKPFRSFLEIAAQMNGEIVNYNKIAHQLGIDDKTIKNYYNILEDTLVGFFLESYHTSVRKRVLKNPKFYFFDTGVVRALSHQLEIPLQQSTFFFGKLFEHFVILECIKLSNYHQKDFRFFYLKTKDNAEIDLIVERPGQSLLLIEIKSTLSVNESMLKNLINISKDLSKSKAICLSREPFPKKINNVEIFPWKEGIKKFFS